MVERYSKDTKNELACIYLGIRQLKQGLALSIHSQKPLNRRLNITLGVSRSRLESLLHLAMG